MTASWRARFNPVRAFLFSNVGRFEKAVWGGSLALLAVSIAVANLGFGDRLPAGTLRRVATWLGDLSTWTQIALLLVGAAAFGVRVFLGRNPAEGAMGSLADKRIERFLERVEGVRQGRRAPGRLRWLAGREDVEAVSRLNAEAFAVSFTYSDGYEAKLKRNGPLLNRSPEAFAFVRDDDRDIGFSSIIALTPNFADQYMRGLVSDRNLVPEMMPVPGEAAGGLVLFAIALDPALERDRGKVRNLRYVRALVAAHAEHLGEMLRRYGGRDTPLIVQAEKASIIRALKAAGFEVAGRKGGDGDLLLTSTMNTLLSRFEPAPPPQAHLKAA